MSNINRTVTFALKRLYFKSNSSHREYNFEFTDSVYQLEKIQNKKVFTKRITLKESGDLLDMSIDLTSGSIREIINRALASETVLIQEGELLSETILLPAKEHIRIASIAGGTLEGDIEITVTY